MQSARYVGSKKLTDKIHSGRQAGRHDVLVVVSAHINVWSIKHRGQWVGVLKGNILFYWDLHDLKSPTNHAKGKKTWGIIENLQRRNNSKNPKKN